MFSLCSPDISESTRFDISLQSLDDMLYFVGENSLIGILSLIGMIFSKAGVDSDGLGVVKVGLDTSFFGFFLGLIKLNFLLFAKSG